MRNIAILVTAAAILGIASFAQAGSLGRPCTDVSQDRWLSMNVLQKKVEDVGFKVEKSKLKNACAEFYVTVRDKRMELFVDPATGTIVWGI